MNDKVTITVGLATWQDVGEFGEAVHEQMVKSPWQDETLVFFAKPGYGVLSTYPWLEQPHQMMEFLCKHFEEMEAETAGLCWCALYFCVLFEGRSVKILVLVTTDSSEFMIYPKGGEPKFFDSTEVEVEGMTPFESGAYTVIEPAMAVQFALNEFVNQ